MNPEILAMLVKMPAALPLYEAVEAKIMEAFPDATIKVRRTQVGFWNRYGFAWIWPPIRRVKGWPDTCLMLTFGLPYQLIHPRIVESVEPYISRWTHHVLLTQIDDLDDQVMEWLRDAYQFSMVKGRNRT